MSISGHYNQLQPTIVVPFFTDYWYNYHIREFNNHPITWMDKDYHKLFNDFDRQAFKQHNQVDKETFLQEILGPCEGLLCKELYATQMGNENLEKLLEESETEVSFNFPDNDAFSQLCFSMCNGIMSQTTMFGGFIDYKQLGELINHYPFRVKVVLHKLPKNLSLTPQDLEHYTSVNVFENVDLNTVRHHFYQYNVPFNLDDNRTIAIDIEEYQF